MREQSCPPDAGETPSWLEVRLLPSHAIATAGNIAGTEIMSYMAAVDAGASEIKAFIFD